MTNQILMIGGAGFVGQAIAAELGKRHQRVLIPTRQKRGLDTLKTNPFVEIIQISKDSEDQMEAWMKRLGPNGVVINLAGILHDSQGSPYGPKFKATHVDLTRKMTECMKRIGLKRYIHMSALGASSNGPSMYSRSKGDAEEIVRESGLDWTIFRPSVIFGEKDQFINLFGRLQKLAPFLPLAGASVKFQPVAVQDVAQAFVKALDLPKTIGKKYDLAGPKVYTMAELVGLAGEKFGCRRPVIPLPNALAYLQAWMLEYAPGPTLMSRDNLASMKQDNILPKGQANCLETEFNLVPIALETMIR